MSMKETKENKDGSFEMTEYGLAKQDFKMGTRKSITIDTGSGSVGIPLVDSDKRLTKSEQRDLDLAFSWWSNQQTFIDAYLESIANADAFEHMDNFFLSITETLQRLKDKSGNPKYERHAVQEMFENGLDEIYGREEA